MLVHILKFAEKSRSKTYQLCIIQAHNHTQASDIQTSDESTTKDEADGMGIGRHYDTPMQKTTTARMVV